MSQERVQIPLGGRGEESEQDKGSAPKGLNRPVMPRGLEKPKALARKTTYLRRYCNGCGLEDCNAPEVDPKRYRWVYVDATTNEMVRDEGLPANGKDWPEGYADWRSR